MSAHAAMFFLMLISQGSGSFSMHHIASYESRAACIAAHDAVKASLGSATQATFACLSAQSLEALQDANK